MKLTWAIVWKDVRRMAGPAALWLGFVLIGSVWFRLQRFASPGDAASGVSPILVSICGLVVIVQMLGLYVLGAALVIEDPLVSSSAFWLTRPISRRRLLFAKVSAGLLLFVAAPTACLVAVWLACGAGLHEIAIAGGQCALLHGAVMAGAIAVASLATSLLQFLPWTLGFAITWFGAAMWTDEFARYAARSASMRPNEIVWHALPICVLAALAIRFVAQRRRWAVLAGLGVLCLVAEFRLAHPYIDAVRPAMNRDLAPVAVTGVTRIDAKPAPLVAVTGKSDRGSTGTYRVPAWASMSDRGGRFWLDRAMVTRWLAANMSAPAVEWRMIAGEPPLNLLPDHDVPTLAGNWASVTVAGAVRLQVGNTMACGACRLTVREVVRSGNGDYRVILEQHDVVAEPLWGWGKVVTDEFAVVDPAHRNARLVGAVSLDRGWLDWQQVRMLRLNLPGDAVPARESDAEIVLVRFRSSEPLPFENTLGGAK